MVILRGTNRLYSTRDNLARVFPIATGQAAWPTPLGHFQIVVKQKNPWWFPPTQDSWAAGAKPVPPGPGNPLGTRWMGLSAPGVGIHGTAEPHRSATRSRTAASGCRFPPRSGCTTACGSGRLCSSSRPSAVVVGPLKLGAQALAMMGVGILASLLVWHLTHQTPPPKVGAPAPAFRYRRLTGDGDLGLSSSAGRPWC